MSSAHGAPGTAGTPGPGGTPGSGSAFTPTGNGPAGTPGTAGTTGLSDGAAIHGTQNTTAPATATQLILSPLPPSVVEGVALPQTVYVLAEDAGGKIVPGFAGNVTVSSNGVQLGGTLTRTPHNGVATFPGLSLATGGGGISLQADSGALSQLGNSLDAIGYTPALIRSAYGFNQLPTDANGHVLDGTGQTIAIICTDDDPNIFNDLDWFDARFGLLTTGPSLYQQYGAASSFLTVLNENGLASPLPAVDPNPDPETILDLEWAHAMAPGAHIVLVETASGFDHVMKGVQAASVRPGVSVVSLSLGINEAANVPPAGYPHFSTTTSAQESQYDPSFTAPGVTFLAATGDYGAFDASYPAFAPSVLAVGGTRLTINADGSYNNEVGWGQLIGGIMHGSGGGVSNYEVRPKYQDAVQTNANRTIPDMSFFADGRNGGIIYDTFAHAAGQNLATVGGTSLATPCLAGLIALVNQGRAAAGSPVLNASDPQQTVGGLYTLPRPIFTTIWAATTAPLKSAWSILPATTRSPAWAARAPTC